MHQNPKERGPQRALATELGATICAADAAGAGPVRGQNSRDLGTFNATPRLFPRQAIVITDAAIAQLYLHTIILQTHLTHEPKVAPVYVQQCL